MTHTQARSKLAATTLVKALEEDVACTLSQAFAQGRHDAVIAADYGAHVQPALLRRWRWHWRLCCTETALPMRT